MLCEALGFFRHVGCIQTHAGHKEPVKCVARMDKTTFLSVNGDVVVTTKLWNVDSGHCVCSLKMSGSAHSVAPVDGKRVLASVASADGNNIDLWNIAGGKCTRTFKGHRDPVVMVKLLDELTFVSASWDRSLTSWDRTSWPFCETSGSVTETRQ